MNKKNTAIAALVIVVAAVAVANPLHLVDDESTQNLKQNSQKKSQNSGGGQKKVKLSNTRYAPYAYKISDDSVSQEERRALAGFKVSKSSSGGVTTIQLDTTKQEYSNQTYKLKNGEQLYFIETSLGDDSRGKEYAMEDDTGVVVDSNGYIVRS